MSSSNPGLKTRREFLRTTVLGGALSWTVPAFVARTFAEFDVPATNDTQVATGKDSPILVILQMAGGNDGLNTVVPYANDHYRRARARIGLRPEAVLKLNDELGLHPRLKGLRELFGEGNLAIIQGVGYPNPNRSHFRSTDIWQTASDANKFEKHGWVGRYFDNSCRGQDPTVGIVISRQMPLAFASNNPKGICLDNPENYRFGSGDTGDVLIEPSEESLRELNRPEMEGESAEANSGASVGAVSGTMRPHGSVLDYVERTALDAQVSSEQIHEITRKVTNQASYPGGQLANSLRLVARMIGGSMPTRIYYVSQGGYDTHTNQVPTQARLLQELGDSVKAFVEDLKAQGNFDRVMLMTFSEFGRRVAENANAGTDHGAAAPMFIAGSKVKAGLLGTYPSLAPDELLNGDLKYTVDFRSVYAAVLEGWLKTASASVLGRKFEPLQIL